MTPLKESFEHNGYRYSVEFERSKNTAIVTLTEITTEKKGPLGFKFQITPEGIERRPFIPLKLYNESIVESLILYLSKYMSYEHINIAAD